MIGDQGIEPQAAWCAALDAGHSSGRLTSPDKTGRVSRWHIASSRYKRRLQDTGAIASRPRAASQAVTPVVKRNESASEALHHRRNVGAALRREQQLNPLGQQHIGMDRNPQFPRQFEQDREVIHSIVVPLKNLSVGSGTVDQMMELMINCQSRQTRHNVFGSASRRTRLRVPVPR